LEIISTLLETRKIRCQAKSINVLWRELGPPSRFGRLNLPVFNKSNENMGTTFQSTTRSDYSDCLLALPHIQIEFLLNCAFEPHIKIEMNIADPLLQNTPQPGPIDMDPALKSTNGWITTLESSADAAAGEQHDRDIFDASMRALNHRRRAENPMESLKLVEFSVELPDARIVQLAADFTDWEKSPLDMIRFADGTWSTTVPLPAGIYSYRFLADGQWYDDPRAFRRDPNAPNSAKSYVRVK
jgi:hypothetical protein